MKNKSFLTKMIFTNINIFLECCERKKTKKKRLLWLFCKYIFSLIFYYYFRKLLITTLFILCQMNSKMRFTKKNTNIHAIKKKNFGLRELNQFHGSKTSKQFLIPQINFYTDGTLTVR